MGQNNRSCILKIRSVLIGILCLFFVINQKTVFGYAFDTSYSQNCSFCHGLRKSQMMSGSYAIRKDVVRVIESTETNVTYDKWSCDVCHREKRATFSASDTSLFYDTSGETWDSNENLEQYPSSHPVPVYGKGIALMDALYGSTHNGTPKKMYCTNCHDPLQVDRGVHKKYVSIFRLKFSGMYDSVQHFDPDPADDTVMVGDSTNSWFYDNPFYPTSNKGFFKFELIPHVPQSGNTSEVFDTKNPRAGKEKTDFDTLGTRSIYFCATCHDYNGFPQEPLDTATGVEVTSTARVRPPNFADGIYGYNASDGNDSVYSPSDGGHVIQGIGGTNSGIPQGGKLPCVECHDTHGSWGNRRLLKDSFRFDSGFYAAGWGQSFLRLGIAKSFCKKCHNLTSSKYYDNGVINKPAGATLLMPVQDTKGRDISLEHSDAPIRETCYSFLKSDSTFYLDSGCHKDPHRPTLFCNGCHADHYPSKGGTKKIHPVGVVLPIVALAGDSLSISAYYNMYADTAEVALYSDGRGDWFIDCLTCHNDHSGTFDTVSYAPQMQGLLRGNAGPTITANLDSVLIGVGNNYPRLGDVIDSSGVVTRASQSHAHRTEFLNDFGVDLDSVGSVPGLCINCHLRIVGVQYNHGGFILGGFGKCNKCHSMHGQHPEPVSAAAQVDSTTLSRPLHYGMFLQKGILVNFDSLNYDSNIYAEYSAMGRAYEKYDTIWDEITGAVDHTETTYVYQDTTGKWFSSSSHDHLIHERYQEFLCVRCHGNPDWLDVVDTSAGQKGPPQIFYDSGGRVDTYYTSDVFIPANRNKSSHPIDLADAIPPGSSFSVMSLKCASGTQGTGCHNPHGNNNYAQLNVMIKDSTESAYGSANVPWLPAGQNRSYVSGMHTFCSLCHNYFGSEIYDSTDYDSAKGRYTYKRHPVGPGVSLLNLYDSADRNQVDSTYFSNLILDFDTSVYAAKPDYNDFLAADTANANTNFVVTCVTCHYQHGSPNKRLRKFSDQGVIECVGCHSKSPDLLK